MVARRALSLLIIAASGAWAQAQEPAVDTPPHVRISLSDRRLWVIAPAGDTLFSASVAVGSGRVMQGDGREWHFATPVGETSVSQKQVAPLWVPPDWHYIEVASRHGLDVRALRSGQDIRLSDGRFLTVRAGEVGIMDRRSVFTPLPVDEEIVFDGTLFIPPFGTANRKVPGVLGPYRLLLANGVGLHGTNVKDSIGKAVTHGCIRLHDEDIAWLYDRVPLGARVVIY